MSRETPVPFFVQETEWSCTVACLRMVLAQLGTVVEESVLRECCGTTERGTQADEVVACAQQYGFTAEQQRGGTLDDLSQWLNNGVYPIVLLNLFPLAALWRMHAVVVIAVDGNEVHYLDPARGQRMDALVAFEQAWLMNLYRAIVVQHKE